MVRNGDFRINVEHWQREKGYDPTDGAWFVPLGGLDKGLDQSSLASSRRFVQ